MKTVNIQDIATMSKEQLAAGAHKHLVKNLPAGENAQEVRGAKSPKKPNVKGARGARRGAQSPKKPNTKGGRGTRGTQSPFSNLELLAETATSMKRFGENPFIELKLVNPSTGVYLARLRTKPNKVVPVKLDIVA